MLLETKPCLQFIPNVDVALNAPMQLSLHVALETVRRELSFDICFNSNIGIERKERKKNNAPQSQRE